MVSYVARENALCEDARCWFGAVETARPADGSIAVCQLSQLGEHTVRVLVESQQPIANQCVFDVVDISIDEIAVSVTDVWVDPVEINENLPPNELNEQTMDYYFGESIARLTNLGSGAYRTSVNRTVHAAVDVDPVGFGPLIEWRVNDEPVLLGATAALRLGTNDVGNHVVDVGPILAPEGFELETYSVTITNLTGEDIIPEGEPVVFIAETNPPGYEAEVIWLSSTKYGVAIPVLGEGPVFVAQFDDTWGPDSFQWLGVKADNAAFGQDQKEGACCRADGSCDDDVVANQCQSPDVFMGVGSTCDTTECPCIPTITILCHERCNVDDNDDGMLDGATVQVTYACPERCTGVDTVILTATDHPDEVMTNNPCPSSDFGMTKVSNTCFRLNFDVTATVKCCCGATATDTIACVNPPPIVTIHTEDREPAGSSVVDDHDASR